MTGRDTLLSHDVGRTSQSPKPGAGHQRLNVFVGTWHTEGQQCEGPIGPAANIRAVETYEWLPGEFFLVNASRGEWETARPGASRSSDMTSEPELSHAHLLQQWPRQ